MRWFIAVSIFLVVIQVSYRLKAFSVECRKEVDPRSWRHGDVVVISNRSLSFNWMQVFLRPITALVTGSTFIHPILVVGKERILHFYEVPYVPEGTQICQRAGAHAFWNFKDDFIRRQARVYDNVYRIYRPKRVDYDADGAFSKAATLCNVGFHWFPLWGKGMHCIAFMATLLVRLGTIRGMGEKEVLEWAVPSRFEQLLQTAGYTLVGDWCNRPPS